METAISITEARPEDLDEVLCLIRELAEYENLAHDVSISHGQLHEALFPTVGRPRIGCLLAKTHAGVAGLAIHYETFSTFRGKPGLFIEDLFVRPSFRRQGIGKALIAAAADLAASRDSGRLEWHVLDWNTQAIRFYKGLGAAHLPEWGLCRMDAADFPFGARKP